MWHYDVKLIILRCTRGITFMAHPVFPLITIVFTARGYAKRGICRRRVSVCLFVCHTPVLYQNG